MRLLVRTIDGTHTLFVNEVPPRATFIHGNDPNGIATWIPWAYIRSVHLIPDIDAK